MPIEFEVHYHALGCGAACVKTNLANMEESPKELITHLLTKTAYRYTFYVFVDAQDKKVAKGSKGIKLKEYIEENGLGDFIETPGRQYCEVRSKKYLKIYIWRPLYAGKNFKEWCEVNKVKCTGMGA